MEDVSRTFRAAMASNRRRVNDMPGLARFRGIPFQTLTGTSRFGKSGIGKLFVGVQNGQCVCYWYTGNGGRLYKQHFRGMIGLAALE